MTEPAPRNKSALKTVREQVHHAGGDTTDSSDTIINPNCETVE
jgi:hypothetical protein